MFVVHWNLLLFTVIVNNLTLRNLHLFLSKMPKFKMPKSLVSLAIEVSANLVHKSAVYLDSISWPPSHPNFPDSSTRAASFGEGSSSSSNPSPNLSPLNPYHASVILSPSFDGLESNTSDSSLTACSSPFCQNYVDFCKQLQAWLKHMPVHLLELVISKVIYFNSFYSLLNDIAMFPSLWTCLTVKIIKSIIGKAF